jgi:hypothetical protein
MLKKLGLSAIALLGILLIAPAQQAKAGVHFGIGVGVAPAVPYYGYAAPPAPDPYYSAPYDPYAYGYNTPYVAPYVTPSYVYPYSYGGYYGGGWGRGYGHDYRGAYRGGWGGGHEFRGGHGGGWGHRR